ncbi:hypothetical protein EE612_010651 [Oryza sativa]|nr:hypothetical protein EE612_010651 [Oryza sativa]
MPTTTGGQDGNMELGLRLNLYRVPRRPFCYPLCILFVCQDGREADLARPSEGAIRHGSSGQRRGLRRSSLASYWFRCRMLLGRSIEEDVSSTLHDHHGLGNSAHRVPGSCVVYCVYPLLFFLLYNGPKSYFKFFYSGCSIYIRH